MRDWAITQNCTILTKFRQAKLTPTSRPQDIGNCRVRVWVPSWSSSLRRRLSSCLAYFNYHVSLLLHKQRPRRLSVLQVPLDARLSTQMIPNGGVAASRGHSACKFAAAVVVARVVTAATCSHFVLPQFATVCRVCTTFSVYCANLVFSIAPHRLTHSC